MATCAITYRLLQEKRGFSDCTLGDFTDRAFRGYLVGAPALLAFQSLLGAGRPDGGSSRWQPFRRHNAVSGHTYVGAVPFITAAQMTDKPYVKGLFYTLSTFCAWSRVNDDAHYLSQALLGWYLAYLSVRAVTTTESRTPLPRGLTIFPVSETNKVGIGLHYQH
jgi:membrane-associated phospholipid phosphatase